MSLLTSKISYNLGIEDSRRRTLNESNAIRIYKYLCNFKWWVIQGCLTVPILFKKG